MDNIISKIITLTAQSIRLCKNILVSTYNCRFELLSKVKIVLVYLLLFLTVPGVAVCKLRSEPEQEERMFLRMTINVAYYTKIAILVMLYYMYEG